MQLERRKSSGVAKGGLTTGIIGTALGGLNSLALMGAGVNAATRNNEETGCYGPGYGWGSGYGMFPYGGAYGYGMFPYGYGAFPQTVVVNTNEESIRDRNGYGRNGEGCCSEDHYVNRYELGLEQQLAKKDSEIALRDANTYNDQKMLEMYKYVDGQLKDIRSELCAQAVVNQKTADSFVLAEKDLRCCCDKLQMQINRESDERKCNDNIIVTYANSTFYPQKIANMTVDTTTAPVSERIYNPIPCQGGCGCNCNGNN